MCGVNPHASENGQFGDEEERIIAPAILMARDQGIDASGQTQVAVDLALLARFYERLGARPNSHWTVYRLTGESLTRLAGK